MIKGTRIIVEAAEEEGVDSFSESSMQDGADQSSIKKARLDSFDAAIMSDALDSEDDSAQRWQGDAGGVGGEESFSGKEMVNEVKETLNWSFAAPVLAVSMCIFVVFMYFKVSTDSKVQARRNTELILDISNPSEKFVQRIDAAKQGMYLSENLPSSVPERPDDDPKSFWIGLWRGEVHHQIIVRGEKKPRWEQKSEILIEIDEHQIVKGATDYGCYFIGRAQWRPERPNSMSITGGMKGCAEGYQNFDGSGVIYLPISGGGVTMKIGEKMNVEKRIGYNLVQGKVTKETNPVVINAIRNHKKQNDENNDNNGGDNAKEQESPTQ